MAKIKKVRAKWTNRGWILKGHLFLKGDELFFKPQFGFDEDHIHINYLDIEKMKKWKVFLLTKGIKIKVKEEARSITTDVYEIEVGHAGRLLKMIGKRMELAKKAQSNKSKDDVDGLDSSEFDKVLEKASRNATEDDNNVLEMWMENSMDMENSDGDQDAVVPFQTHEEIEAECDAENIDIEE